MKEIHQEKKLAEQEKVQPETIEIFDDLEQFGARIDNEDKSLREESARRRAAGETVKDQDFAIKYISYDAKNPDAPALLILGGMGPLAGVQAAQSAFKQLQESSQQQNVALHQLTSTPDRTAAIKEKKAGDDTKYQQVIRILKAGIIEAANISREKLGNSKFKVVIICNTAHNFIDDLADELPADIEIVSIIESAANVLVQEKTEREQEGKPKLQVAALYTDGTKEQGLYSKLLKQEGVEYEEPKAESQKLLMQAIYDGVKAIDPAKTLEYGEKALEYLINKPDITHILAGCTEIPEIISVVKKGTQNGALRSRLAKLKVIDPVEAAFGEVFGEEE